MPSPVVQFRASELILEKLELRTGQQRGEGAGAIAARDLTRYYNVLSDELFWMHFSADEAQILLYGHVDSRVNPRPYRLLWATVDDAIRERELDRRHSVDGAAFVARIRAWLPGQTIAIIDLLERYWALPAEERSDPIDTLKQLGLHIR